MGLKKDGTVVAVGSNKDGQTNITVDNGFSDISAIAAGYEYTIGIKNNGKIVSTLYKPYWDWPYGEKIFN